MRSVPLNVDGFERRGGTSSLASTTTEAFPRINNRYHESSRRNHLDGCVGTDFFATVARFIFNHPAVFAYPDGIANLNVGFVFNGYFL